MYGKESNFQIKNPKKPQPYKQKIPLQFLEYLKMFSVIKFTFNMQCYAA